MQPRYRDYWKECYHATVEKWLHGEELLTLWIILLSIPIIILSAIGIQINWKSGAQYIWSGALALWFIFSLFFVTPYSLWKNQKQHIIALESDRQSKLSLATGTGSPYEIFLSAGRSGHFYTTPPGQSFQRHICNLQIQNVGGGPLTHVKIDVDSWADGGGPWEHLGATLRRVDNGNHDFYLRRGEKKEVGLAMLNLSQQQANPRLCIGYCIWDQNSLTWTRNDLALIKVVAMAAETAPIECCYEVSVISDRLLVREIECPAKKT